MNIYKKKYDKALERARVWKEKSGMPADKQCILDDIFPELKESEDERIRKGLINYFNHHKNGINIFYGIKGDDILAWLEKQGEQKSNPCDECINIKGCINCENGELREIEQKPAVKMKTPEESLGIDSDTYNEIVNECIYGEQKSQRMISAEAKEAMYDKPAWSEEDEKMVDNILTPLATKYPFDIYQPMYNWLKSLKTRCTWKPSDEQMEALDDFIYAKYPNIEKYGAAVKSLYQDLKKLREDKL